MTDLSTMTRVVHLHRLSKHVSTVKSARIGHSASCLRYAKTRSSTILSIQTPFTLMTNQFYKSLMNKTITKPPGGSRWFRHNLYGRCFEFIELTCIWAQLTLSPMTQVRISWWRRFLSPELLHIRTNSSLIEPHNSMIIVEQFHHPIRRAFNIIRTEAPNIDDDAAFIMAVKAMYDSVIPDGLILTFLVFVARPRLRLPHDKPMPTT